MAGAFGPARRQLEMMNNPEKFAEQHLKILTEYDFSCPFNIGDIVVKKPEAGFMYPLPHMPAIVVQVYNDFSKVTIGKDYCNMACAVVTEDDRIAVFGFNSKDFDLFKSKDEPKAD
jgi:hypothetical protein